MKIINGKYSVFCSDFIGQIKSEINWLQSLDLIEIALYEEEKKKIKKYEI